MLQDISIQNYLDVDDNPAGGYVEGLGLAIRWQEGPLEINDKGERLDPNGCFVETIIDAAISRLEFYQESKFNCDENAAALLNLKAALEQLQSRTKDREKRGVEGTHKL